MRTKKKWSDDPVKNQLVQDAWLNILVDEEALPNPLLDIPNEMREEPHIYITWLLSQPEYFSFICKEIMNVNILPFQAVVLHELWHRKFPMLIASRGASKSFMLGLYALLRLLLLPRRKIVICGAGFRQSKIIFDYMAAIYDNAPLLKDILGGDQYGNGPRRDVDTCRFKMGESIAYAIPIGDGSKIRGLRANDVFGDEFASIQKDIFETVIAGFAVVKPSPDESVRLEASKAMAKKLGITIDVEDKFAMEMSNQLIISGTADFDFRHFADYWRKWKDIITSRGDVEKLAHYQDGDDEESLESLKQYKNYCIIRLPVEMLPKGFFDDAQIARARATLHTGIYESEFGACFTKDSMGFYKRSLIESCIVSKDMDLRQFPEGATIFNAMLKGNPNGKYIIAVDPACSVDNFSIVVLELHPNHRRIVYCWVTNEKEYKDRVHRGLSKENDYYSYCCRKIRDLMSFFPCERLVIDSQGGGRAIIEGLHDNDKFLPGESPIWYIIDPQEPRDTDGNAGLHLIEEINFASAEWTSEANNGMRKDFEDKALLFPFFDNISLGLSSIEDARLNRVYDTLEDCIFNIEELKNELTTIVMTETPSGRDKWDTPEIKLPGGKKGRLKKDRYSALLMGNAVGRKIQRTVVTKATLAYGDFAGDVERKEDMLGPMYSGPDWIVQKLKNLYD